MPTPSPPLPPADAAWDARYPPALCAAAAFHFAPLAITHAASDWLAARARATGLPVADLGAGAGKFCVAAAARHPNVRWVGLEIRPALLAEAERWRSGYALGNLSFRDANITTHPLDGYAGAFCFNPFYERLDASATELGDGVSRGRAAYREACTGLRQNLSSTPPGFRLAAYYCHGPELPAGWSIYNELRVDRLEGLIRPRRAAAQ